MFQDEARIVAKLNHPNIVQIYDLGKADDTYFIAMEYIPGRNLSSIAKKAKAKGEPLTPANIAQCIAQACDGLNYAHTRRDTNGQPLEIVHRDVSPQNIIVAFSGAVKLVDFGIAKAATKIAHTRAGVSQRQVCVYVARADPGRKDRRSIRPVRRGHRALRTPVRPTSV